MVFFQRRLTRLLIFAFVFLFVLYTLTPVETPPYLPTAGKLTETIKNTFPLKDLSPIGGGDSNVNQTDEDEKTTSSSGKTSQKPSAISEDKTTGPLQIEVELQHVDNFQHYVENLILSSLHPPYMINGRPMAFDPSRWKDFDK